MLLPINFNCPDMALMERLDHTIATTTTVNRVKLHHNNTLNNLLLNNKT